MNASKLFRPFDTRQYFDFIAPLSIEQTADILDGHIKSRVDGFKGMQQITFEQEKHDLVQFQITRNEDARFVAIDGAGDLSYVAENRTRIRGYVRMAKHSMGIILIGACTHVIIAGLFFYDYWTAWISLGWLIFMAYQGKIARKNLIEDLVQTLTPQVKAKRKNA